MKKKFNDHLSYFIACHIEINLRCANIYTVVNSKSHLKSGSKNTNISLLCCQSNFKIQILRNYTYFNVKEKYTKQFL